MDYAVSDTARSQLPSNMTPIVQLLTLSLSAEHIVTTSVKLPTAVKYCCLYRLPGHTGDPAPIMDYAVSYTARLQLPGNITPIVQLLTLSLSAEHMVTASVT